MKVRFVSPYLLVWACVWTAVAAAAPAAPSPAAVDPRSAAAYSYPFDSGLAPAPDPAAPPAKAAAPPKVEAPKIAPPRVAGVTVPATPTSPVATPAAGSHKGFKGSAKIMSAIDAAMDTQDHVPSSPSAKSASGSAQPAFWQRTVNAISALMIVLALIMIVYILARRFQKGSPLLGASQLARVLGRMALDHRTMLYFLGVGDKVLVLGVTQHHVSSLGTFDATALNLATPPMTAPPATAPSEDFLAHLRAGAQSLEQPPLPRASDDAEIASLRNDIERLQHYLKEGPREPGE